jgi:FMN-dependent NADH-azoreductase
MTKILHVDASSRGAASVTKQLSQYAVDALLKSHSGAQVKTINLTNEPPRFISEAEIGAMFTPVDARSPEQAKIFGDVAHYSRDWVESDIYVFGIPMYNFSVPAVFKAYIDMCIVVGVTFKFGPEGLQPLLKNKKVIVVSAGGSNYEEGPMKAMDFVEPYLRTLLGFVGVTDVSFARVAGHGDDQIKASVEATKTRIDTIVKAQTAVKTGV